MTHLQHSHIVMERVTEFPQGKQNVRRREEDKIKELRTQASIMVEPLKASASTRQGEEETTRKGLSPF